MKIFCFAFHFVFWSEGLIPRTVCIDRQIVYVVRKIQGTSVMNLFPWYSWNIIFLTGQYNFTGLVFLLTYAEKPEC